MSKAVGKSKAVKIKRGVEASASPSIRAKFRTLPDGQQKDIAKAVIAGLKRLGFFGRGGYKVVHGNDQANRPRVSAETEGEIGQLTIAERNRMVAFARNAARNSERLEGILHQIEINVVGVDGGKATFEFPAGYENVRDDIKEAFAEWAQEAEYFEDHDLQDTLKLLLRTQLLGGDCVVVFDDDITARSTGQVITFEPDCIGDLDGFAKLFPKYEQFQGIVKDNGKTIGVTVSWGQRGQSSYKRTDDKGRLMAWTLIKPDGVRWKESPFIIYRESGRFNQIRGSSRLWPGLGTIVDLADTQGYEVQASKNGAQKIGQVLQNEEQNKAELDSELENDSTHAPIADDEIDAAVREAKGEGEDADEDDREKLNLEVIEGAGVIWDLLPPNVKMELFDTKHPNDKLVEFSNWLHGGVALAIGLGRVSATGEANSSYSASMVELLLSSVEYEDEFHKLEKKFLDWLFYNWSKWAQRRGLIPGDDKLPPHWRRVCVKWQRPQRRAVDPVKEQQALNSGLKNGTILYRDKFGPDWRSHIDALAEEINYCKQKDVPHLALQTASGSVIPTTNAGDGEKDE